MPQVANLTEPRDKAFIGLPVANTRRVGDFDEVDFNNVSNLPVFAEHQTTAKDGRPLKFGRAELSAIVERCNRRIKETGDYATVTLGHTPSPEEKAKGAPMPEVVGLCGPYRLGMIGNPGERKRYAILADFHYYKEDMPKIKKHPRRSPEVWLEDSYAEMFFDPIALLGAEAPRLDMGLLYSAQRNNRVIEKYAAVAPAAANTFIPDDKFNAENEGNSMISPDDIRQIVDAIYQMPEFQYLKAQMAEQEGMSSGEPEPMPEAPAAAPEAPMPGMPEAPGMEAAPAPEAPMPPAPGPEDPEKMMGDHRAQNYNCDGKYDPKQHGADMDKRKYDANATGEYQEVPPDGTKTEHQLGTQAKYAAADEMDDDEFEEYGKQRASRRKKKYEAGSADEDKGPGPAGNPTVEPVDPGPTAEGDADGKTNGDAAGSYQGSGGEEMKYAREQHAKHFQDMADRLQVAEQAIEVERSARVDAERLNTLTGLYMSGVRIEPEKEIQTLCYAKVRSNEDFEERVKFMRKHAGAIPMDAPMYIPESAPLAITVPGSAGTAEKYSREQSERALKIGEDMALKGETPNYESILEDVRTGRQ